MSMAGEKWTCVQSMVGVETSNGGGILPILLTMNWGVTEVTKVCSSVHNYNANAICLSWCT